MTSSVAFAARGEKRFGGDADVLCDLTEEDRRQVTPRVERDGRLASVPVTVLAVRTALPHEQEAEAFQEPLDLPWLQHGEGDHRYATWTV